METARGVEHLSFSQAIREGRSRVGQFHRAYSYVERGFYSDQLERVFALFPREQVLLLNHDDLMRDHRRVLNAICGFVGVAPFNTYPENELIFSHEAADVAQISEEDEAYLYQLFSQELERMPLHMASSGLVPDG